jgi:hypothetical protein
MQYTVYAVFIRNNTLSAHYAFAAVLRIRTIFDRIWILVSQVIFGHCFGGNMLHKVHSTSIFKNQKIFVAFTHTKNVAKGHLLWSGSATLVVSDKQ